MNRKKIDKMMTILIDRHIREMSMANNCYKCDEWLDNNTSLDDIVLCNDCAMDKVGY